MEALWILAGRNDLALIQRFNKRMAEYSDDGRTLYGAYGYRWRRGFAIDQLKECIRQLKADPDTRRCVLTTWTVEDLPKQTKDKPCNTHIYFRIIENRLDMTVCNRSNDLLWGMLGSNYVHFSFLHEYMSQSLAKTQGKLHQFTNNLHVYINDQWKRCADKVNNDWEYPKSIPLVWNTDNFLDEVARALRGVEEKKEYMEFDNLPLRDALYMSAAWDAYQMQRYELMDKNIREMHQPDWRLACRQWINRRVV